MRPWRALFAIAMYIATMWSPLASSARGLTAPYTGVMVVPTGIGCAIGGFAGDALPACKLLASVCDRLITHPNVMNGAMLYEDISNVLYVEGLALDQFAANRIGLLPVTKRANKVGLLLDSGIEEGIRIRHLQVADAFRATLGIDVAQCVVTAQPIGVRVALGASGASWGTIDNLNTLLSAAKSLIEDGVDAIAVVARFPEDETEEEAALFDDYRKGAGVDAIAGAEALISHLITREFMVPCAHAPAFASMNVGRWVITCLLGNFSS